MKNDKMLEEETVVQDMPAVEENREDVPADDIPVDDMEVPPVDVTTPTPEEVCDGTADLDAQIREAVESAVAARIGEAVESAVARAVSEALAAEREAAKRSEEAVAEAVRLTEERLIGHIRARGTRPPENGMASGTGVRMHPAVDRLTRRDRERLARMAAEGETVRL